MQEQPKSQEELAQWAKEQFQKANQHLAENGYLFKSVITEESRYLAPFVAVWKISTNDGKLLWVLSGDLPVDYVPADVAADARSALKHFALKWQLKAENIRNQVSNDKTQMDYAALLESRAESLAELEGNDQFWQA
ncbi:DUF4826 family protein [Alteromonas sp. ASW11-36]|uniref:DUF4826 family protein n=1 Tax=Alteromonas arenosi TaxID=3055817 RepID=A0ABT7SWM1_9ALTE|nr:DUF4826 family protein [Alteromonas sp. ASW11-36]MDM7860574.1 DUF4826 family protein [Alteromonas sp. ASW11-36]